MENQGILLYIGIALIILLVLWYIWTVNNLIEMFLSSIVAGRQNHHQEELIDIPEPEQQNVNVAELLR